MEQQTENKGVRGQMRRVSTDKSDNTHAYSRQADSEAIAKKLREIHETLEAK